jgi:predicted RecA/RadA family phage recombinase
MNWGDNSKMFEYTAHQTVADYNKRREDEPEDEDDDGFSLIFSPFVAPHPITGSPKRTPWTPNPPSQGIVSGLTSGIKNLFGQPVPKKAVDAGPPTEIAMSSIFFVPADKTQAVQEAMEIAIQRVVEDHGVLVAGSGVAVRPDSSLPPSWPPDWRVYPGVRR